MRITSVTIQAVDSGLDDGHIGLDALDQSLQRGKGSFRNPVLVQMRSEDRDHGRVLREPNLQEFFHLTMSL
jgi:hypothetical protein